MSNLSALLLQAGLTRTGVDLIVLFFFLSSSDLLTFKFKNSEQQLNSVQKGKIELNYFFCNATQLLLLLKLTY
jgi:hypothetical protein